MVTVRQPRWPPCPYMVKTFKNLLLHNRGCLGAESLYKSLGTGDQPKLLKELSYIDVWPFYGKVKFASLCICMSPIHLNGKIVENFKRLLLLRLWANFAQIPYGATLGWGNKRLLKLSQSVDQDGRHMVKTFKNLLLQNRECLGAEFLQKSSGTRGLPKLLKELSYVDIWPFYGRVKFASLCIYMSPIHLNRKIVETFKLLLLWSHWAKFAQIPYWAFLSRGNERLLKWLGYIDQDGRHAHIW